MFKVEVIADASGEWCGNGMRFHSRADAERYADDLASRWTAVREWRVVECEPKPEPQTLYGSLSPAD